MNYACDDLFRWPQTTKSGIEMDKKCITPLESTGRVTEGSASRPHALQAEQVFPILRGVSKGC